MRRVLGLVGCAAILIAGCGGSSSGDSSPSTSGRPSPESAVPVDSAVATDPPLRQTPIEEPASSGQAVTTTIASSPVTDEDRILVAECVAAVWGVTGFSQQGFDDAVATCTTNADELDSRLGVEAGTRLRVLLDTTIGWVDDDISDSDYPAALLSQVVELRDEYYPANSTVIADESKRAIAGCIDALEFPAVIRANISSFDDRSDLDEAIDACGVAGDAVSIDAALDAPGVSIATLVSVDMAAINVTLRTAGLNTADITVDNFDAELLHRVDRYNFFLPSL